MVNIFLEIRAKDANNKWSTVGVREFVVCTSPFIAAILPATEQNTCTGAPVNLSVPTGYSYQWQLNGANIFNASSNTYSATQTGDYTVVVAQNGCQFTTNPVKVNVTTVPSPPTITTPNQTICSGQNVTLVSSNCSGIVTWSNGSTGGGIIVAPTTSTTYTATCTVNNCSSTSSSTSSVITVNAALAAPTITGPASAVCQSSSVSLTASGCTGVVTWNTGKTGNTLNFVATAAGTYSAICASGGCVSISSSPFALSVTTSTANAMALTASSSKICVGQSASLTATGCAGSILWSNSSATSVISVSPTVTGTYSATCTDNGCTGNSVNTLQIQVVPIPNAPTIYGQSQTICKGKSISLSAYFCTGGVINWSNGFVGQTQSVNPITTTTYTATCTKDGCPSVNSNGITLTVSECQNPAVNITKIEYFIDNDPGFGSGVNVPIIAASVINNLNINVPIQATFVNGFHNLSIRAKDSNNKWAWTIVRPFWKEALPSTAVLPNIVKLEYFIDNDPGYDAGTDIPITAGTSISNLNVTMPLDNSLVTGWHKLTLRAKDANGAWGIVVVRPFYKDVLPANASFANITALEYFIDTDPGNDLGTAIPITANPTINNIPLVVNMSGLTTGSHFLEIRAKDVNGKWSTVGVKKFDYGTNIVKIGTVAADLCGQTNLSLPYTLEGTFNAGNTVKVQLLDANNNLVNSNLVTQTSIVSGTLTVPLPNVSVNTIYKFRLVTSDPVLTSDVVQFTLKPTTLPSITSNGATTFCSGGSVSLTVSNCTGTVVWSNGATNNMILVSTSGTYSATCNMGNSCSLPTSNSVVVIVNVDGASAPSVSGNTTLCGTSSTTSLTATGCSGGTYRWFLNATTSSIQSAANPYTTPVIGSTSTFYVACVISGCESTRTPITVNVNPIPTVSITGSVNLNCANPTVTRTASGGGTYLWSGGLGTNAIANIISAGTYTVTVTDLGCSATATTAITSNTTPPTPVIAGVANLTCATISVIRTASGGTSYSWSNSLGTNDMATIVNAGTYTVTVTAANGCTATATTSVTSNTTPPTVGIAGSANLNCTTTTVTRTASGGGSYLWSSSLGTNALVTIASAGTYTVTVTAANGCTATATTSITSSTTPPTASILGSINLNCTNPTVTRTASGGGSYLWSSSLGTNALATIASPGTYTVTVTAANGCTATATTSVTSDPIPPTPTISPTNPSAICVGQSVSLTANGCSGLVTWSNGATGSTTSVSPTASTIYTANYTVNGCVSNNSTPVSVTLTTNYNYPLTITPSRVFVCPNTQITLSASGCPNTITWTGGATGSSLSVTPTVTGTYTATCAAGGSGNVEVTVVATTATLTNVDNIQTGTAKFQVTQTITSNSIIGTSTINPKPNVLYQAGNSISLQPGFSTTTGSIFSAKIQGCN